MNRVGHGFVSLQRADSAVVQQLIVDDRDSVKNNSDLAVNKCQLVVLPFASGPSGILARPDAPEAGADSLHPAVTIQNLSLIDTAKKDATISVRWHFEVAAEVEIRELSVRAQVSVLRPW